MSRRRLLSAYVASVLGALVLAVSSGPSLGATIEQMVSAAKGEGSFEFYATNTLTPRGARHPNVGRLFAAFLTTPEAQEIWERYNGQTSAFVPGTTTYKYA